MSSSVLEKLEQVGVRRLAGSLRHILQRPAPAQPKGADAEDGPQTGEGDPQLNARPTLPSTNALSRRPPTADAQVATGKQPLPIARSSKSNDHMRKESCAKLSHVPTEPQIVILRDKGDAPETLFPASLLDFKLPVSLLKGTASSTVTGHHFHPRAMLS